MIGWGRSMSTSRASRAVLFAGLLPVTCPLLMLPMYWPLTLWVYTWRSYPWTVMEGTMHGGGVDGERTIYGMDYLWGEGGLSRGWDCTWRLYPWAVMEGTMHGGGVEGGEPSKGWNIHGILISLQSLFLQLIVTPPIISPGTFVMVLHLLAVVCANSPSLAGTLLKQSKWTACLPNVG